MALTDADIIAIPRDDVKYSLHHVRGGGAVPKHLAVYEYYLPRLVAYNLPIYDFSVLWDLDKKDHRNIVSGHTVRVYQQELADITDLEGNLVAKEPPYVAPPIPPLPEAEVVQEFPESPFERICEPGKKSVLRRKDGKSL